MKAICNTCNRIIHNKASKAKYCDKCALTRQNASKRRWKKRNPDKNREVDNRANRNRKTKIITCRVCKEKKKFRSHDMCIACYSKWYRLNIKLKGMTEEQKNIYLEKKGLLNVKHELSVEDLKKDLGVP